MRRKSALCVSAGDTAGGPRAWAGDGQGEGAEGRSGWLVWFALCPGSPRCDRRSRGGAGGEQSCLGRARREAPAPGVQGRGAGRAILAPRGRSRSARSRPGAAGHLPGRALSRTPRPQHPGCAVRRGGPRKGARDGGPRCAVAQKPRGGRVSRRKRAHGTSTSARGWGPACVPRGPGRAVPAVAGGAPPRAAAGCGAGHEGRRAPPDGRRSGSGPGRRRREGRLDVRFPRGQRRPAAGGGHLPARQTLGPVCGRVGSDPGRFFQPRSWPNGCEP